MPLCVLPEQSNMELPLTYDSNATAEIAEADTLPNFRLFTVPLNPQPRRVEGWESNFAPGWETNSAQAASNFSAVCYLSALHFWRMRRDINATHFVGLVWAAVGGTCIESWMDGPALKRCGLPGENQPSPAGRATNTSTLFNGMISPLVPFSFRAVWWYQGVRSNSRSPIDNHSDLSVV